MLHELCVHPEALVGFLDRQPSPAMAEAVLDRIDTFSVWCWDHSSPRYAKQNDIRQLLKKSKSFRAQMIESRLPSMPLPPTPKDAKEMVATDAVESWYLKEVASAQTCVLCDGVETLWNKVSALFRHFSHLEVRDRYILRKNNYGALLTLLRHFSDGQRTNKLTISTGVFGYRDEPGQGNANSLYTKAHQAIEAVVSEAKKLDLEVTLKVAWCLSGKQHARLASFAMPECNTASFVLGIEPGFVAFAGGKDDVTTLSRHLPSLDLDKLLNQWSGPYTGSSPWLKLEAGRGGSSVKASLRSSAGKRSVRWQDAMDALRAAHRGMHVR